MTTTSMVAESTSTGVSGNRRVAAGALGGLIGGLVFGVVMQMMDMIATVAMLVGSESVAMGWVVHLVISVALGVGFGLVSVRGLDAWGPGTRTALAGVGVL